VVIEPAITIVMSACKKEEIMLLLPDVDQSIAPDQIKFFALVYTCLTMSGEFIDLGRSHALMRGQGGDNSLNALCCKRRSATGFVQFIETLLELWFQMNNNRHDRALYSTRLCP
jgi:hypothetical protein